MTCVRWLRGGLVAAGLRQALAGALAGSEVLRMTGVRRTHEPGNPAIADAITRLVVL